MTPLSPLRRARPDWDGYLAGFHAANPGITEDVLARCTGPHGVTPYEWLVDGVDPDARTLDVACGSAPTRHLFGDAWTGIDRSAAELTRAARSSAAVARADAQHLPVRDGAVDLVVCSMALMLFDHLDQVLREIRRVLDVGGELRVLVPSRAPLTAADRATYVRLAAGARRWPRFPDTALGRSAAPFRAAGLAVRRDEACRFTYPLAREAECFVRSWYTDGVADGGPAALPRWSVPRRGDLGVGLRCIVAACADR